MRFDLIPELKVSGRDSGPCLESSRGDGDDDEGAPASCDCRSDGVQNGGALPLLSLSLSLSLARMSFVVNQL